VRIGVAINETWAFFQEIYDHFREQHETTLFQPRSLRLPVFNERVNRRLYNQDLRAFLRGSDAVFFEWSSEVLAAATQLTPGQPGPAIVTRLHRYEMYHWADKINWESVDRLIVVSQAKQREFASRFPQHAAKTVVIPEAIDLSRFNPGPRPYQGSLGILCHLTPRKRVYELILAFSELCRAGAPLHLHIGGGPHPRFGDYYEALQVLVRKLDLGQRVTFHGPITRPQDWYQNIDIFISNSYSEGLQVSPMEAIASGCYCLSHDWDGADELLPESDLYLTDRELSEAVRGYAGLSAQEKQERKQRQFARVSECFDIQRVKVQIREVVEAAAANRSAATR
jgi:glycosyltransferase involved in cell wall biosynthesis